MRKILFYFLFLSLCTYVCSCRSYEKERIKVELYKNGVVKKEFEVKGDSIKHGYYHEYYPNGNLKVTARYNENKLDSAYASFYANGQFSEKLNYSNGYLFGEQKFYFDNGALSKYSVVDGFDDVIYVKKWDRNGNVSKEEGVAISPNIYCDKCEDNTIKKGNVVFFEGMISQPPNTKADITYMALNERGLMSSERLTASANNTVKFEKTFKDTGEFVFSIACVLRDSNGVMLLSDTVKKKVKVVS